MCVPTYRYTFYYGGKKEIKSHGFRSTKVTSIDRPIAIGDNVSMPGVSAFLNFFNVIYYCQHTRITCSNIKLQSYAVLYPVVQLDKTVDLQSIVNPKNRTKTVRLNEEQVERIANNKASSFIYQNSATHPMM